MKVSAGIVIALGAAEAKVSPAKEATVVVNFMVTVWVGMIL